MEPWIVQLHTPRDGHFWTRASWFIVLTLVWSSKSQQYTIRIARSLVKEGINFGPVLVSYTRMSHGGATQTSQKVRGEEEEESSRNLYHKENALFSMLPLTAPVNAAAGMVAVRCKALTARLRGMTCSRLHGCRLTAILFQPFTMQHS